ncbi:hypothetical protein [Alteromonas sp. CYL-A6]|uniref:hypothetical protein n=1 Tax=Alteromonas nitratireducens TaxID=3390813 RepID=UPI0034BCA963
MEWFLAIFENVSDRAKFFAIFISSLVAISVVILNNYFSRKTARRTLDIEKLELMYQELLNFRTKSKAFIKKLYTKEEQTEELRELMKSAVNSLEPLEVIATLHFPDIKLDSEKISENIIKMYNDLIPTRYKGGDDWYEKERDCYQYISNVFESISTQCVKQMKSSRH